ncbi:MAG TPA: AAA family ATPase [Pseudonocardiaceae bacterium]|nr:AAA family ATPase [Pseudonocardiaceae bacterium]
MAVIGGGSPAVTGMAERGDVLGAVDQLLQNAGEGRGGALFVVGPAGLGKTTVLERAIGTAGTRFAIGVGRGDQVESVLPFGLIGQALDQVLGQRSPGSSIVLDGDAGETTPQARFYGILRGVRDAAADPLLLALDDLHWSDLDSLTAIHLICRRLASLPVALVATARPWPDGALISALDLAEQGMAQILSLAPLSAAAARTLLRSRVGGDVPGEVIDQAIVLCSGNPLLVEQVALELRRSGRLPAGHLWVTRFAGVGTAGRRYLQAASVLGTRFRVAVAAEVAGLATPEAAAEVDGLFQGGLLFEAEDGWARFTHALIRQGVYDTIAPPRRRDLHAASFRALVASGAYPAEAAEHAVAAQLAGDPDAVASVARAGRTALRAGAVRSARQHLDNAMLLAGETASTDLLFDVGAARVADGASEEAMAVYERMMRLPELPRADRVAVLRHLGQVSFFAGQVDRSGACYDSAADLAEQDHPALAVEALLDQACHQLTVSGPREALPWANRAMELATARGTSEVSALATWGTIAYRSGNPDGLAAAAAAATRVEVIPTVRVMERHTYLNPVLSYAISAVQAERFADAERLLTEILNSAERRCEPTTLVYAAVAWIDGLCRLGRLAEASVMVDRLGELSELLFPHWSPLARTFRALVLLEQGHLEQAARYCQHLADRTHDQGSLHRTDGLVLYVRGALARRQGDIEAACALFAQLEQWADDTGEADPAYLPWAADAVAAYLASGRHTDARRVLDWVTQHCAPLPSRWPRVIVAAGQAALAEHTGDRARAGELFAQALDLHAELPMPLTRAQVLTDYGAFLTRVGESVRARPLLAEALRSAEDCGAGWHARRARAEWRRAGGRTGTLKPDELSPQEASVVRLAQAGRSNRQIAQQLHLSIKTVETHLGHVYRKLGIRNRWQLPERTIPPDGGG